MFVTVTDNAMTIGNVSHHVRLSNLENDTIDLARSTFYTKHAREPLKFTKQTISDKNLGGRPREIFRLVCYDDTHWTFGFEHNIFYRSKNFRNNNL